MNNPHYQNSECIGNWLHDYRIVKEWSNGIEERCARCADCKFFPYNVPNDVYLSYHIRLALQPSDPYFAHEYPEVKL